MKKLIFGLIICYQAIFITDVKASENTVVRQVLTSENKQPIVVEIAPGYGVNISFDSTDEVVEKVWLDNPSFVTIDVDGCLTGLGSNNCQQSSASVIHLRRIKPLDIQGIIPSNTSLMTVVTRSKTGSNNLYLFQINPVSQPQYLVIDMIRSFPQPQGVVERPIVDYFLVVAIQRGIRRAEKDNLLDSSSELKQRLDRFLDLLKQGKDVTIAASNAGISLALVEELKQLGNYVERGKGKVF